MTDGVYIAPGYRAGTTVAELWQYDGSNTPTKVWDGPSTSMWQITCIFPYNSTVLVFMCDETTMNNRVYQYNPSTGIATKVVDDYTVAGGRGDTNPARQVALDGNMLYVVHNGYTADASLYRLNPTGWGLTQVLAVPAGSIGNRNSDIGAGGVAVSTDGNIYCSSGRKLYSSASGDAGSFTEIYDSAATASVKDAATSGLYPLTDGYVYFGAHWIGVNPNATHRIYRVRSDSVGMVFEEAVAWAQRYRRAFGLVWEDSDAIVSLELEADAATTFRASRDPGTGWEADFSIAENDLSCVPGGTALLGSQRFFTLTSGAYNNGNTILKKRTSGGSLSDIHTWSGYGHFPTSYMDAPMAVAPLTATASTTRCFFVRTGR